MGNGVDRPVKSTEVVQSNRIYIGGEAVNLLSDKIGAFAAELAARLEPIDTVLHRYGVSKQQLKVMLANQTFRDAIKEAAVAFGSYKNIGTRIKLKAQILIELGLNDMYSIFADANEPAASRVSAWAQVKTLTGLEKPVEAEPREKFNLIINLPGNADASGRVVTIENPEEAYSSQTGEDTQSATENIFDGGSEAAGVADIFGYPIDTSVNPEPEPFNRGHWNEERTRLGVASVIKIVQR